MEMMESDQANGEGKIRKENDEIYVPNWLLEVFAWITRVEMANSALSTASQTFRALCWPKLHGNVNRHSIERLLIQNQIDSQGNSMAIAKIRFRQYMLKAVPIPQSPMPDYIAGFGEVALRYLDGQILAFIERIMQHCDTIELNFISDNLLERLSTVVPMTTAAQIIRRVMNVVLMKKNKTFTSGFRNLDDNLDQMELFKKLFCSDNNIVEHNLSQQNVDVQQQPEQQNVFRLKTRRESEFIQYLKNDFSNATQPINFFIELGEMHAEFTMKNKHTRETLQLYHFMRGYMNLIRHPSGHRVHWKDEGERKIMQSWNNSPNTRICINIDTIGDF